MTDSKDAFPPLPPPVDSDPYAPLPPKPGNPWLERLASARTGAQTWLGQHASGAGGWGTKRLLLVVGGIFLVFYAVALYWSCEPAAFTVIKTAQIRAAKHGVPSDAKLVTGYLTTATLVEVTETLLRKPGGYVSNDKTPPGALMDNMASWEWGVLQQTRDFALSLRNDMSRSQTQSTEDRDLMEAQTLFNLPNDSWMLPAAESNYRKGIRYLDNYLARLADNDQADAQFFARADNLRDWLKLVEKKLGSLSQRLSASVRQYRVNTDLAGDAEAAKAKEGTAQMETKTPWLEIDNVFYEARGTAWALLHLLKAVEVDFAGVLEKKNALVSLRQIIRELEATQKTVWSPLILNGAEFGLFANHCLVMSSYISRANAAIIDLRNLLVQG